MKKRISFFLLLLTCIACSRSILPKHACVTEVGDVTDSLLEVLQFNAEHITPLIPVINNDESMYDGATVRLTTLADVRMTDTRVIRIPAQNRDEGNDLDRKKAVQVFSDNLLKEVEHIKQLPIGKSRSSVFEKLAFELDALMECTECTHRTMVVASDLHQFSGTVNTYDSLLIEKFVTYPECLDSILNKYHFPETMQGVVIYLVHQSSSPQDDKVFYVIATGLKRLCEAKGAQVHITSSFTYN